MTPMTLSKKPIQATCQGNPKVFRFLNQEVGMVTILSGSLSYLNYWQDTQKSAQKHKS